MDRAGWRQGLKPLLFAVLCAAAAFVATWLNYRWLNPQLEARTDWLRDTQGLLFTTIPVGTVAAGVAGWYMAHKVSNR